MKFHLRASFVGILFLALAGVSALADDNSTSSVHFFYTRGKTLKASMDLGFAFEEWLSSQTQRVKLLSIDLGRAYCNAGRCLIDLPASYGLGSFSDSDLDIKEQSSLEILETPQSLFWISSPAHQSVLEEIRTLGSDPGIEAFLPALKSRPAQLGVTATPTGDSMKVLDFAVSTGSGWSSDFLMKYRFSIEDQEMTAYIVGKSWGGPSRVKTALKKRLEEINHRKVSLLLGKTFSGIGDNREIVLEGLKDLNFDLWIPHYSDFESHWNDLRPYLIKKKSSPAEMLLSNLTVAGSTQSVTTSWKVIEAHGARIGIFSLLPESVRDIFEAAKEPFDIVEPIHFARHAVEDLRAQERVDTVICVSYLKSEDDARLRHEVGGIDVLIGEFSTEIATSRRTVVELDGWSKEFHGVPALHALAPTQGFGEIRLDFVETDGRRELTRLEEQSRAVDRATERDWKLAQFEEQMIETFVAPQQNLLPDARQVWPQVSFGTKRTYDALEFWNLASGIIREKTKAEISFVKIHPLGSRIAGPVGEGYVDDWLWSQQKVFVYELSGREVRTLWQKSVFEPVPVDSRYAPQRRYHIKTLLAASGIDSQGRVHGRAIDDRELYRVALAEEILGYPDFRGFREDRRVETPDGSLAQTVVRQLKEYLKESESDRNGYLDRIRNLCESRPNEKPLWRLHWREMSLQFSNTQVHGADSYSQVSDARIQASNQIFVRGISKMFSEYSIGRWRWDTGLSADYGRVTLKPEGEEPVVSETVDQALLETDVVYRANRQAWSNISFGPFFNLSYDTEWTRPDEELAVARRAYGRVKSGARLYEGRYLRELSLAALWQRDYSKALEDDDIGWESSVSLLLPLPKSSTVVKVTGSYRQIDNDPADDPSDLRQEISLKTQLKVPVWEGLNFSPYIDFYRFQGQHDMPVGTNIIFGFGLDFSRLWKPIF